jgi:hypothetical protein
VRIYPGTCEAPESSSGFVSQTLAASRHLRKPFASHGKSFPQFWRSLGQFRTRYYGTASTTNLKLVFSIDKGILVEPKLQRERSVWRPDCLPSPRWASFCGGSVSGCRWKVSWAAACETRSQSRLLRTSVGIAIPSIPEMLWEKMDIHRLMGRAGNLHRCGSPI